MTSKGHTKADVHEIMEQFPKTKCRKAVLTVGWVLRPVSFL